MAASSRSARARTSDVATTQSVAPQGIPGIRSRRAAGRNERCREGDDRHDREYAR